MIAGTLAGFTWLRLRLENRRYRRAIRRLEAELHEMRSLPLTDGATYAEDQTDAGERDPATAEDGADEGLRAASSGGHR